MKFFMVMALGFCISSVKASADLIMLNTLYNTGEGTTASNSTGSYDTYWTLYSYTNFYTSGSITTSFYGSSYEAYLITNYPGPNTGYWLSNNGTTVNWIGTNPTQGNGGAGTSGALAGVYDYRVQFDVTGTQMVHVTGEYAADNQLGIEFTPATGTTTVELSGPSGGTSTDPTSSNYIFSKSESTGTAPVSQYGGTYGSNAPISFSFYATASTGTNDIDFLVNNLPEGTSSQDNASGLFIEDFEVQAVPEPSTWAIILMGLGLLAFGRRHALRAREGATAVAEGAPKAG
jgi:hypothetical protein